MNGIFKLNIKTALILFIVIDVLCVGMGMGVPILCILLGFPVGWYIAKRVAFDEKNFKNTLKKIFKYAITTSLFTFIGMCIIWARMIPMIFAPDTNFQKLGIPFILYEPKISFIGWLILMIFISPFLQLLATIFASYVTLQNLQEE